MQLLRTRQRHDEHTSRLPVATILRGQTSAMISNDLPRDAQAESAPGCGRRIDRRPIEPVENAVEIIGRDSRSIVHQVDSNVAVTALATDVNLSSGDSVTNCILDEIVEQSIEVPAVADNREPPFDLQADADLPSLRFVRPAIGELVIKRCDDH